MVALRWLFFGLVLATTASAMSRLWEILRVDGLDTSEMLFLALVAILFCWISISFWIFCIGAYARWRGISGNTLTRPRDSDPQLRASLSRTALVFPVRNEEPGRFFAGISAVIASIRKNGVLDRFDFYILSDSTAPSNCSAEGEGYRRLHETSGATIYYRCRLENTGRKSGNIADFCRNWGSLYDYMVVLDADSLMTAETLVALVRLMDNNPRTALIQVSPQLVGRDSLFARIQQFSSSVYGPIYSAGLALLQGPDGNYWGHNAIIRIQPFMQNCGLPELPGRAPLGGEIMSHDFVEAALLRRAGWELHLATDLGGSYEEPPPTLVDYMKRDRRWCQGNLQHLRLIFAQGFRIESRGHLATGVMSYLSSPLWVAMLVASAAMMLVQRHIAPVTYLGRYPILSWPESHTIEFVALISAMVVLLYGPKLIALLLILRDREACRAHGGGWNAAFSVLLESVFSTLLAPIAMLSQSMFVINILLGEATGWGTQQRTEHGPAWSIIVRTFGMHTFVAITAGVLIYTYVPGSFWWFSLLLVGPVLAIPFAGITSSRSIGQWAMRRGLFLAPCETGRIPIIDLVRSRMHDATLL
ncbi:MAG: glucans biosynthesis glucosyltransferase MdoH [Alphaproteobacteria bacterium]|nr:glucans biosynthesis glucosyltransferase MdoH [Alphaproteobacteria bacterium]